MTIPASAGRMHAFGLLFLCAIFSAGFAGPAAAQTPTTVTVRAVAHDAKIIGSNVGGARIIIREYPSGRVLADGLQRGSTGDTALQVSARAARHETMYNTEGAAHFTAELMLDGPTRVEITAIGPMDNPEATTQSTKRMWLMPGRHVTGEGIILELNGFDVSWIAPNPVDELPAGESFRLEASVQMLCGCPTEPGGLWNADDIEVRASFFDGARLVYSTELPFAGTTSRYAADIRGLPAGSYRVEVTASDPMHANFGLSERTLIVN